VADRWLIARPSPWTLTYTDAEVPPDFFAESDDEDDTHPDERISGACGPSAVDGALTY